MLKIFKSKSKRRKGILVYLLSLLLSAKYRYHAQFIKMRTCDYWNVFKINNSLWHYQFTIDDALNSGIRINVYITYKLIHTQHCPCYCTLMNLIFFWLGKYKEESLQGTANCSYHGNIYMCMVVNYINVCDEDQKEKYEKN